MDKCDVWIADEMDITPLQVRYSWSKIPPQMQSGTPLIIIYTRWSIWHEGLECHVPMGVVGWRLLLVDSTHIQRRNFTHPDEDNRAHNYWVILYLDIRLADQWGILCVQKQCCIKVGGVRVWNAGVIHSTSAGGGAVTRRLCIVESFWSCNSDSVRENI